MQKEKVLVPDGALVKGRIRRLERYSDAGDYFIVALEFTRLETPGGTCASTRTSRMSTAAKASKWRSATPRAWNGANSNGTGTNTMKWDNTDGQRIWTHEVPGVGTFFVRGSIFSLPPGFKTVWKTQRYPLPAAPSTGAAP